ncbi:hypothetical protein DCAR_0729895 [Daucus carota subsp. sativus]|uniref:Uncharacterized protein n=1 Tax=Daucus carota subsp. sativus TaxID=79200 RepID=A0A161X8T2_DAUCS|nr:hypothetical protein DCAR_0729895 [Daucus carota subsp. sativus]
MNLMDEGVVFDKTDVVLSLPVQVSSLCPNSWLDPNLASSQNSRSVSCSAPSHSSISSSSPEARHIPGPAPVIDQLSSLPSSASPQQYLYPSYQVSSSSLCLRPIVRNPSPASGASHPGIKSNPTLSSLQSRAPPLSYATCSSGTQLVASTLDDEDEDKDGDEDEAQDEDKDQNNGIADDFSANCNQGN